MPALPPMRLRLVRQAAGAGETSCGENLPRDFTDSWDGWWQRGLADTQARWRDEWMPLAGGHGLAFLLPRGLRQKRHARTLAAERGKVGRYSPLTIARCGAL